MHQDLDVKTIGEVIREFAIYHERKVHEHANGEVQQLMDSTQGIRRFKRVNNPCEVVSVRSNSVTIFLQQT